ncbi:hypothetical protein NQ317_009903 [Molorchus minor]|uniref:GIY-YIG nuclease family protein n=1 Tax=Molorchus minor TaxID=1323400 RepID=A0ABQ9IV62_9CUCU|nr:hypothetical protein NQ317_009903 [Molorchus minor]
MEYGWDRTGPLEVPGPCSTEHTEHRNEPLPPAWLNDTQYNVNDADMDRDRPPEKKGRTYIATRTLPNGQGAFAYIGVSLSGEEPMWIGAGESSFDRRLDQKFRDMVPPVYEMEKILSRRKDPREREKVLTFYDVLMTNIADELEDSGGMND